MQIELLILLVILAVGYLIIAKLIMPVIPPTMQAVGWAIIGILLLIGLLAAAYSWHGIGSVHLPSVR